MPGVPTPQDQQLAAMLAGHEMRLRAVEQQQQISYINLKGQPVVNTGMSPGSNPPQYGLQLVNPPNGQEVGFLGEDADGNVALKFRDSSGNVQAQFDAAGLHFYDDSGNETALYNGSGVTYYDSSGNAQVVVGLLNIYNQYGLEVRNPAGTLQQVSGVQTSGPGSLSTSSTSPTAISGVSVTADVGLSGEALVTLCGSVEMNGQSGGGGYVYMGVSIDGSTATNWVNNQTNLGNAQITESLSASRVVTGLSVGSHTFTADGWIGSSGVSSGVFGNVYLTVQAL